MEKSTLVRLVRSFSPVELRDVRKFLNSPFFNQRQDLIGLFEQIAGDKEPEKESLMRKMSALTVPLDDQKLRLLMSYLHGLLEQYLAVKEMTADKLSTQLHLAVAYRKRRMSDAFERTKKNLEKALEAQPLRNTSYYDFQYKIQWEAHQLNYVQNPTNVSGLRELSRNADIINLAQKLRLVCLLAAHQTVYQSDMDAGREEELIAFAERPEFAAMPVISVYLHCYRMLRFPSEEAHFQGFKSLLLDQSGRFSEEEMHGLFILAINYCIRRLNAGGDRYFREAFDLYREGLNKEYLFEDGMLTRFTYHNIVAIGLRLGELNWVRHFIGEYKNRLEKPYRESAFSYNLARLEYESGHYGYVLELLQKANYRDPLLNLAAKTLLLKTYYDLGEYDLLQSHLDAMRNYIHRKRVIGYHRTNYLNIIRFMEKIMRLNTLDKAAAEALRQAVEQEEALPEKAFFLKILER
ncbi:MAG: hypothetical protein DYG98_03845 [Haliscomenobacteraceae bacterium CHB4]|nr:hypothetical protein [Haliscomenobacteraceae bacterium CHB4]